MNIYRRIAKFFSLNYKLFVNALSKVLVLAILGFIGWSDLVILSICYLEFLECTRASRPLSHRRRHQPQIADFAGALALTD